MVQIALAYTEEICWNKNNTIIPIYITVLSLSSSLAEAADEADVADVADVIVMW